MHNIPIVIATHSQNLPVLRGLYRNWKKWGFEWHKVIVLSNFNFTGVDFSPWDTLIVPRTNWKEEWLFAIGALKELGYERVIWYLDDFYLTAKPNLFSLRSLIEIRSNYIRLTPFERPFLQTLIGSKVLCEDIPLSHPYYSSLQIALWNLEYFQEQLLKSSDIWDFETLKGVSHKSVSSAIFTYRHSVEKGRWKWYTKMLFREETSGLYYLKDREGVLSVSAIIDVIRYFKFKLFGY
jgi:hypothetical protein